jgi:hypothetical protein
VARTVILGKSGTGKSWKLGQYLESTVPHFTYGLHFDIEDEETGLAVEADGEPPVFQTLIIDRDAYEGEFNIPQTLANNPKVRVVPDGLTKEEMQDLFGICCAVAMKLAEHPDVTYHLSVDEAHVVMPMGSLDPRIDRALSGGRKRGLEWAVATQRAQKIHEEPLSQSNWGIYFQMTSDRDLKKVAKSVDSFNAEKVLPKLGKRECIVEDKSSGRYWTQDTNELTRIHPHAADDDGVVEEVLEEQLGEPDGAPGDREAV